MKKNSITDYDKNAKPLVKVLKEKPFSKRGFRQGDDNNSPISTDESYEKGKSAFGQKVNLTNEKSVTDSTSAKLQKASKLSGRAKSKPGSAHKKLV